MELELFVPELDGSPEYFVSRVSVNRRKVALRCKLYTGAEQRSRFIADKYIPDIVRIYFRVTRKSPVGPRFGLAEKKPKTRGER